MSRYRLSGDPLEIVVGWDPPLETFFLQVLDPARDEEEEIILWLGMRPGELPSVADLDRALDDHAAMTSGVALTPELRQRLEEERANSARPTRLAELAKQGDLTLICWCKRPDRQIACHGDVIKRAVEYLNSIGG